MNQNMQNSINYNKSILNQIKYLCTPLSFLKIDYFTYVRYYNSGEVLRIDTNLLYNRLTIENCVTDKLQFIIDKLNYQEYVVFTQSPINIICKCMHKAGFKSFISTHYRRNGYVEGFIIFSTNKEKDMSHSYLNNLPILERFFQYFKSEAINIINSAINNKILLHTKLNLQKLETSNCSHEIKNFLKKTELKKLNIYNKNNINKITQKEALCMYYLSKGFSHKEIGNTIGISSRTVETHIINLKYKLDIYSTSQLRDCFIENNIEKLMTFH